MVSKETLQALEDYRTAIVNQLRVYEEEAARVGNYWRLSGIDDAIRVVNQSPYYLRGLERQRSPKVNADAGAHESSNPEGLPLAHDFVSEKTFS